MGESFGCPRQIEYVVVPVVDLGGGISGTCPPPPFGVDTYKRCMRLAKYQVGAVSLKGCG